MRHQYGLNHGFQKEFQKEKGHYSLQIRDQRMVPSGRCWVMGSPSES